MREWIQTARVWSLTIEALTIGFQFGKAIGWFLGGFIGR
jgi:hypothetical protein